MDIYGVIVVCYFLSLPNIRACLFAVASDWLQSLSLIAQNAPRARGEPIHAVTIEAETPCVGCAAPKERRSPIEAIAAKEPRFRTVAEAGSRQKEAVAVRTNKTAPTNAVYSYPFRLGVLIQLLPFISGRGAAPIMSGGGIIFRL